MKRVAVIGAGLGGMTCALRLAHCGYEVDVYEKNPFPGGKAHSINFNGFRFDAGPSLITIPFVIKELFDFVDEDIKNYLILKELDILCRYYYTDGTVINAYKEAEKFADEIERKTTDDKQELFNFINYTKEIYDSSSNIFLFGNLYSLKKYLKKSNLKSLLNFYKIDTFRTMHKAITGFFEDEKNIKLFSRYATYNGSSPFLAPATLNIIAYVENAFGGYYLENGINSLSEAFYNLSKLKGVNYFFNKRVNRIIVRNSQVQGVETDDGFIGHDYVVSNADALYTKSFLLNEKLNNKQLKLLSTSAVVFYWGVKKINLDLNIHNILFADNYEKEFEYLFNKNKCSDDLTVYIYISSKYNTKDAPENYENWFVMVNAPRDAGQDWEKEIEIIRSNVIRKIDKLFNIDLNEVILSEEIMFPRKLEKITGSYKGSIYGYSSNSRMSAFMRERNKSIKYKGLYYCGGSAHPGGGIPLVILSGKLVSELIINNS